MRLGRFLGAGLLAVSVAGAVGWWQHRARAASRRYEPPVFVEAPKGARAPSTELLGAKVGFSRLAELESTMKRWDVTCADRSMHTLMAEIRDKKKEEIRRAEASGHPDAVSGASIVSRRTARDDNPQIRISCDGAASNRLGDRRREPSSGRVLFVFDDRDAPVRHASYQRNWKTWEEAARDYADTLAALRARFGEPSERGGKGAPPPPASDPLPKYASRAARFRFSDLEASASVTNLGGRGFAVRESVEVPWPVRADAPARP